MTTITVSVNNKTMIMLTGSKPVDGTVSPDLHRAGWPSIIGRAWS